MWKIPRSTIHNYLKQYNIKPTPREHDIAFAAAAVLLRSMSKVKKRTISTPMALKELERLGYIQPGEISVSRLNELLRYYRITPKDMRASSPCVRLQTTGPNVLHQADFTEAPFVYLDNLTVRYHSEISKKKPSHRQKIIIGVVRDHFSRCFLAACAYPALAENTELAIRLCYDAWSPKLGISGLPHGLPWILYTDQGPGFKSQPFITLLKNLYITIEHHSPANPRATGLAETGIRSLSQFLLLLRSRLCQGVSLSLEQLNAWMQEWIIDENSRKHPQIPDMTRTQVWQTILDEDIRRCPPWEIFIKLSATRDEPRKVTPYGTIKYNNREYHVGTEYVGRFVYPYEGVDGKIYVDIPDKGIIGPINPGVPTVLFGTYAPPPYTESERNLQEVRRIAQELGYTPDDVEYERQTDECFLPREGRPIIDDKGSSEKYYPGSSEKYYASVLEAKSALADLIDLSAFPWEIQEEIQRTLEDRADKAGCVPVSVVNEIVNIIEKQK
ncbi:MAG: transposase family protein [candidate division WOR-3 bacterium]|nr:transposase family protein [candidate division WOR-3 bacterium]